MPPLQKIFGCLKSWIEMTLLATIAAFFALSSAQTAAPPQTVKLAGRDVAIVFPKAPTDTEPSAEYLNWHGWAFLPEGKRTPGMVLVPNSWPGFDETLAKLATVDKPIAWHTKIIIYRQMDILESRVDGSVYERRSSLEDSQIKSTLEAVARFMQLVKVFSDVKIAILPDVVIEDEPFELSTSVESTSLNQAVSDYCDARVNQGSFDADDKVFRGPYQTVLSLEPALAPMDGMSMLEGVIKQVPILFASTATIEGQLDVATYRTWLWSFENLATAKHIEGSRERTPAGNDGFGSPDIFAPPSLWAEVADLNPPDADSLTKRIQAEVGPGIWDTPVVQPATSYHSQNVTGTLQPDTDRGTVLRYAEKGLSRSGALVSPEALHKVEDANYLSFWVKSSSHEPLALRLGKFREPLYQIAVGRDAQAPVGGFSIGSKGLSPRIDITETAFKPDGTWQRIVVDLSKTNLKEFSQIEIGPSQSDLYAERQQLGPIVYDFDKFELLKTLEPGVTETLAQPITPDFDSKEPQARILALQEYVKNPTPQAKPQALKLLSDLDDNVRLNAVIMIGKLKDPEAEQPLTIAAVSLDPRIDEAAMNALAALNTDSAWMTIRHALLSGTTDLARITAAKLLGAKKDPTLAGPISVLMAQRSWQVRRAAAEAISGIPGKEASIILMTFLNDLDPSVRLAVTKGADVNEEYVCNKLLYSQVNDTSDAVRAWSSLRLITSPIASFKSEGYKGVRDDSRGVRILILQQLAAHPSEEHRQAIRIAVADSDPGVRAAALAAFATIPGIVSNDEIANTLHDKHPWVQEALVELALAKKLSLPKETILDLQSSVDKTVAEKAKGLAG